MIWYTHDAASTLNSGTTKFYADGTLGWFAHIAPNRMILVKKFTDSPLAKKAPGVENEIELYTTNKPLNNSDFVEMENQGSYDTIATNDSVSWDMKWFVRKIPDTLTVAVGNPAIVAYINQVLASGPTALQGRRDRATIGGMFLTGDRVAFTLEHNAAVSLSLLDARGAEVKRLHSGALEKGRHSFVIGAIPRGMYLLVLRDEKSRVLETRMLPSL
jgi:hypothetical protein